MNQFDRWIDHRLKMKNAGKVLIISVLLVEVAVGASFLIEKDDSTTPPADAEKAELATAPMPDNRVDNPHASVGSVLSAASQPAIVAQAPLAVPSSQSVVGHVAPEIAPSVAPSVTSAPQPSRSTQPVRKSARKPEPAPGKHNVAVKTASTQKPARPHDSGHRTGSNHVASAMTNQLVKDSAQLDPSLPPPLPKDNTTHRTSNPVAAAMTDQLVRESANVNVAPPPTKRGMK